MLVFMALVWRPWIQPYALKLAERTGWSMLLLALLPVVLRLALLAHHPVPSPDVYDEFGHLLQADTLRHFRLANPPHPLPQFFETFFVLQEPAYSSIYPVGQGLALAIGWAIFGLPGPEWYCRWRPSARCATGCCVPGPLRGGRSRAGCWR